MASDVTRPDVASDDPRTLYSPTRLALFRVYLRTLFWRRFNAVRIAADGMPPPLDPARPLIVVMNHPSWWDPALLLLTSAMLFPDRRCYGPIDAGELARYRLFRRMGVFGIEPDQASGTARFLSVGRAVLSSSGSALFVTAEGTFNDVRRRPVRIRPGVAHLARRAPAASVLPLAIEYGFWNENRPEALLRVGRLIPAGDRSTADWTALIDEELARTMDRLADAAMTRNPALFRTLLAGRAGFGGVYDAGRRLRAAFAGSTFEARHERGPRR